MSDIGPEYLADLESERQFATQGNRARRVKLEKGHAVLARFLPFPMGPNRRPYARIANHWVNMKPHVCPRDTHVDWGGNPEAFCPICEIANHLYDHAPTDEIRDAAYKIKANPQWLMWCLVLAKDDARSEVEYIEPPELWKPWEFQVSKTSWDELSVMMRRAAARGADLLDVETGTNVWVSRNKKGYRLDRDETGPSSIIRPGENFDEIIAKVWTGCKEPVVNIESEDKLAIVAEKIRDQFASGNYESRDRGERNRGGRVDEDDSGRSHRARFNDDDDDDRGSHRNRSDNDSRTSPRKQKTEEDDVRYDDPPAIPLQHRASLVLPPPPRRTSAPAPIGETDSSAPRSNTAGPPLRRFPPPTSSLPLPRASAPSAPRRAAPPPPPPPSRGEGASPTRLPVKSANPSETAPIGEGSIDESEETIPEERRDPAPPAEAPLSEGQDGQDGQSEATLTPPQSPSRKGLDAAIRGRLVNLRERKQ